MSSQIALHIRGINSAVTVTQVTISDPPCDHCNHDKQIVILWATVGWTLILIYDVAKVGPGRS